MPNFHPNFPFGKGMWIWRIQFCESGSISAIINRCKQNNISHVLVKCGDGNNTWSQFNKNLVKAFHDAGLQIYSWSYNYGANPLREADIAIWALEMGVDGHVFNAEGEYERLANNANAAKLMLEKVRAYKPDAFLAHAPFPIIDSHKAFPYREFGRYCDAVMPQLYWGAMNRTPDNVVNWMVQQWSKWEATWIKEGNADVVKPLIPIGQTYDEPKTKFVGNGKDIRDFVARVKGYKSVNFWSYQHTNQECWDAIRDVQVDDSPAGIGGVVQPPEKSDKVIVDGKEHGGWFDDPADKLNKRWWVNDDKTEGRFLPYGYATPEELAKTYKHGGWYDNPYTWINQRWNGKKQTFLPVGETELPEEKKQVPITVVEAPAEIEPVETQPVEVPTTTKPTEPDLTEAPAKVEVPDEGSVTVTMKKCDDAPGGVEMKIKYHKTHLDYLLGFIQAVVNIIRRT